MPMLRYEDLPPHLRPENDPPHLYEELPLLEELPPPPEIDGRRHDTPPPGDPFMRR